MDKSAANLFRCSLPMDAASQAVIDNLRRQGLLCADHTLRRGSREIAALLKSEIKLLKDAGIALKVLKRVTPPAATAGGLDLSTGFVSAYLDTAGIHAAFAALQTSFPALS